MVSFRFCRCWQTPNFAASFLVFWGIFRRHRIGYSIPGKWGKNAYGRLKNRLPWYLHFPSLIALKLRLFLNSVKAYLRYPGSASYLGATNQFCSCGLPLHVIESGHLMRCKHPELHIQGCQPAGWPAWTVFKLLVKKNRKLIPARREYRRCGWSRSEASNVRNTRNGGFVEQLHFLKLDIW